jgi:hypothetical protein
MQQPQEKGRRDRPSEPTCYYLLITIQMPKNIASAGMSHDERKQRVNNFRSRRRYCADALLS